MMNTTIRQRIMLNCFLSLIDLMILPLKKSRVSVDAEAITSEERVDMDAANTRTITTPIMTSENHERMVGIIESKMTAPLALRSITPEYRRPKLPRK